MFTLLRTDHQKFLSLQNEATASPSAWLIHLLCCYELAAFNEGFLWIHSLIYLLAIGLFLLAWCPPGSSLLKHVPEFPLVKDSLHPIISTCHIVYSSISGRLGCFYLPADVSNAAYNWGGIAKILNFVDMDTYPEMELTK